MKRGKLIAPVLILVSLFVFASCAGTGAVARGWSGTAVGENALYVGTMEGKLAAINLSSRNRQWTDYRFEPPKTTSLFGCSSQGSAVAIYGTPALGQDRIYVGGYDGKVYAIDAATGLYSWEYPRREYAGPVVGGVVQSEGRVFYGDSNGVVYSLDAATGNEQWRFKTGDKVWGAPAVDANTVYIGSFDKKLYALNINDGKLKWSFATDGAISARPIVNNGVVYVGSFDRHTYAINAADGTLKWRSAAEVGNWFWADLLFDNNTVYAPSLDGKVYAFKAGDGSVLAAIEVGEAVNSSPVLTRGNVVLVTKRGKVLAIDTTTNQKRQIADLAQDVNAPLAVKDGVIYIHTDRDNLYAIDAQSGLTLWQLPLKT